MIQSFLILGDPEKSRDETIILLKSFESTFAANSPDITIVAPVKNTTSIDQVRQIKGHINQKPVSLPYKFIIFENAHTLNKEAQNALLKTLEEPPPNAIIIMESTDRSFFLPTILSRVALVWAKKQTAKISNPIPFTNLNTESLLGEIGSIDNPKNWLDSQMIILFRELEDGLSGKSQLNVAQITSTIENCKEAKKMIDANVNPKFVLANLALQA